MMKYTEGDTYLQKNPFFEKNLILWILGIISLLGSLYSLLHLAPFYISIDLLVIGAALEALWFRTLIRRDKQLLKFVEETSSFVHKRKSPLTPVEITDILKSEGFAIKEYPHGNYYCFRQIKQNLLLHFFISNNDTPGRKEAEGYSTLFVTKMAEAGSSYGNQFFIAFEYGGEIAEKAPDLVAVCRKGFMIAKNQGAFGFWTAYDTKTDTLYFAEAVTRIIWRKRAIMDRYTTELFRKLFLMEMH